MENGEKFTKTIFLYLTYRSMNLVKYVFHMSKTFGHLNSPMPFSYAWKKGEKNKNMQVTMNWRRKIFVIDTWKVLLW